MQAFSGHTRPLCPVGVLSTVPFDNTIIKCRIANAQQYWTNHSDIEVKHYFKNILSKVP